MLRFVLCLCVAFAAAVPLHYEQEHHYAPKYSYNYVVKDPHTHDMKSQWETRNGDKVQGSYRLVEPDGSVRIVDYVADGHNGFRAIVTREKHGHKEVTVHGKEGYQSEGGYEAVSEVQSHFGGGYREEVGISHIGGAGYGLEGESIGEGYGHYYN